ncbi:hypothetical protein [Amaricoccus sp.]|uniref:hypothetical protein n=1 Tax=Amaricoccus sp. TaxID=1872485 RepID=UPI001B40AEE2|nr:hypothetical protein [Amaricoccus sp.]MBP7000256.1 hypothetical protein [Amaricoccus sp.]
MFLGAVNKLWRSAGDAALPIAISCAIIGFLLLIWSYAAGLGFVVFRGEVEASEYGVTVVTKLADLRAAIQKQVGFILAPNWGIAAWLFVPVIVWNLCEARGCIEDLPEELVRRGMLRPVAGGTPDPAALRRDWETRTSRWTIWFPLSFLLIFLIVIVFDFWPVVGQWLIGDGVPAAEIRAIRLNHGVYEFDWSVSSLFPGHGTTRGMNFAFSLAAYVWVALVAPSFILGAFAWSGALVAFLSPRRLRKAGYELIPDLSSPDRRLGIEVFEGYFKHLLLAALFTAGMALGMHLQNVFLRSAEFDNLHSMAFGAFLEAGGQENPIFAFGQLVGDLQTVGRTLDVNTQNIQFLGTGIAFLLLALLTLGTTAGAIAGSGRRGRDILRRELPKQSRQLARLRRMQVWPLEGAVLSRTMVLFYFLLIILSMWWVNFAGVVLFGLVLLSVPAVLWLAASWARARWERWIDWDDDNPDQTDDDDASPNA